MIQILLQYIGETTIQHVLILHLPVLYKNHCPLKRTLLTWNNVVTCFMTYQKHSFRCKFCQSLAALSSIFSYNPTLSSHPSPNTFNFNISKLSYLQPLLQLTCLPVSIRSAVEDEIRNILDSGIIVESSVKLGSPVVPVRKEDGGIRLCELNKITPLRRH